jgi:hypothetical protein
MAKRKVFISYDYDHDKNYKNLLVAWDKNEEFDFAFTDMSADVSVDSDDAAAIRRAISAKINAATYFLCLVGKHTHKSRWVAWEIGNAKELKKRLVAVKIDRDYETPAGLLNAGVSWAYSFTLDSIRRAVEAAS